VTAQCAYSRDSINSSMPHLTAACRINDSMPQRGTSVGDKLVVALVCDVMFPHSHGGREFRYQALLPRLAEHVDIHVYTMRWWSGDSVYVKDGVTFHAISPLLPMYTRNGRRSIIQGIIFALFCFRLLNRPFDVLDVDQIPYFHLFPLRLIATIRRKPLIATWHEVWGPLAWRQYLKWLGWLGWLVEAAAIRMPDHIVAASAQTSTRLHEFLGEGASIVAVPNGIDIAAIGEVPASPHKVDLVTVGRLIEHKRVHVLLDVISSLHAQGIYVTCRIIGDGPDRPALQKQAKMLGLDSAVEFCYDVAEQNELYALIKASRLFVSLSAREGFGIAVLEAITCGVPVLTTTAPDNLAQYLAMRYSMGSVCGTHITEIADAITDILVQPDAGYSSFTDSWIEEYSWETMVQHIVNIYRPGTMESPVEPVVSTPIARGEFV
jgi:glycosyltransferase involved in cell wall biosynthesis